MGRAVWTPPEPEFLYPMGDSVDLTGKDALEFKWIVRDPVTASYTDFRIYKTYQDYAANLIMKVEAPAGPRSSYSVKADTFQNGEVYTCVIRVVTNGGKKSNPVYASFKVKK